MAYSSGRVIHDADSHIFESLRFYRGYADASMSDRLEADLLALFFDAAARESFEEAVARHDDPEVRATAGDEIMQRKLWDALGAFRGEDRSKALDYLGFSSQIVFDSFFRLLMRTYESGDDLDLLYGAAGAYMRAITDFCAGDPRLLPAGYVPLADPARSVAFVGEAIESGCAALTMSADCPRSHAPSHVDLEPVWAQAAEAGVPVIYHLGSGRTPSDTFKNNGRPQDKGFAGGDGTFTSLEYLGSPLPVIETLNCLIVDGVLDRNPGLRIGVLEFGSTWLPGYLRFLDGGYAAYSRIEGRLQKLEFKLSEYVQRQVRIAPYHFEDTGWLIREAGPDVAMFSSDYPHKEGGRDPIAKFEKSMDEYGISDADRDRFYAKNFEDLLSGRFSLAGT